MKNIFITGTDTDVGKTYVTCALLRDLRRRGHKACGYKPVACGDRSDARAMRAASDSSLSLERINPLYLRTAAAPSIAAQFENKSIEMLQLISGYKELLNDFNPILVEGAGGWEVPLNDSLCFSDFAQELQLPIVLVVNNKIGAVNHTLLTLAAIKTRGLNCAGIILNHINLEWDTASLTNRRLIEQFSQVPVLAELIHGEDEIDSSFIDAL